MSFRYPALVPLNLKLALTLAALVFLTAFIWWLPNRPRAGDLPMPTSRFNSLSFAPFRPGQSPLTNHFPTAAQVEEDVARLAPRTAGLRTYAAIEGDYTVAAIAQAHGLKLWQGVWLGADRAQNAREIARAIAIAHQYPETVTRIIVGNEVLLRRDLPPEVLIAAIDQVRAAVTQPVTYADVWEFWEKNPDIARHVDIVTIHLLPYWEDQPTGIDHAIAHVRDIYFRMKARFPNQPIAIGETGWPSRGRWRQDAAPSVVNQAVFLRRFIALAQAVGFDYNLIEAFDQRWKYQNEGTVGANWGLWTADRTAKFPLSGPVIENPDWPVDAVLACVFAALILIPSLWVYPKTPAAAQIRLTILAVALGNALAYAWSATAPELYDIHLRVAATVNLGGQAAFAALLMRRAARRAVGLPTPWRSGAETAEAIRGFRPPPSFDAACADLTFLFAWTAAVLALLLVFDPRYRDFPTPAFAVPLIGTLARAWQRDLPHVGGRAERVVALTLIAAALTSAVMEGAVNHPSLLWTATALILAAPLLRRVT
jgi:exo-beta-1,3-glucanase (GH17 family)